MTRGGQSEADRRIWAAVASKGTVGGKRRLAGLLSEDERAQLGLAMLEDVLDVLLQVSRIERVLLVTPDEGLLARLGRPNVCFVRDDGPPPPAPLPPHQHGAVERQRLRRPPFPPCGPPRVTRERGSPVASGLNPAFELAQRLAEAAGVDGLLLMPADLPIISAAAVQAVLRAGRAAGVVLVPDRASSGTNALLAAPPTILAPSFGEGSFPRHQRLAAEAGLDVVVVRRPTLALDLDTSSDVAALLAGGADCRARRLLVELGADARLDAVLAAEAGAQARNATI